MTDDIPRTPGATVEAPGTGTVGSAQGRAPRRPFFDNVNDTNVPEISPPVDLACYDCDVVYKKRSDEWTACPRCGEELTEVTIE